MTSLVPVGFHSSSHKIFANYKPPVFVSKLQLSTEQPERQLDCAICLQSICDPVTLIACDHFYCFDCITQWFSVSLLCPMCKTSDVSFLRTSSSGDEVRHWNLSSQTLGSTDVIRTDSDESNAKICKAVLAHKRRFFLPPAVQRLPISTAKP